MLIVTASRTAAKRGRDALERCLTLPLVTSLLTQLFTAISGRDDLAVALGGDLLMAPL